MTMLTFKKTNDLSPLDLTIINYIENNQEKVIYMRVRELAAETFTSPATVLRCIKKLGFETFPEFKAQLQLKLTDKPYRAAPDTSPFYFQDSFEQDIDKLVQLMTTSDIVYCLGVGNSQLMATYASNLLTTIGIRSFSTDPVLSSYSLKNKDNTSNTTTDVCLIFSASGESHDIVKLAKDIQQSGIVTVSVSSQSHNSLANYTTHHFHYNAPVERTPYNLDLSSQLPTVYFIETLVHALIEKKSLQ